MLRKVLRIILTLIGLVVGYGVIDLLYSSRVLTISNKLIRYSLYGVIMIIAAFLFYLAAPYIFDKIEKLIDKVDELVFNQPKDSLLVGLLGVITGIIIAFILSLPITMLNLPGILDPIKILVTVLIYIVLAAMGYRYSLKYKSDIIRFFNRKKDTQDKNTNKTIKKETKTEVSSKLLDTSVLIDGRIQQIANTGFIEGDIIVPNFVLKELQVIADSADDLKRERGRRGLDIVQALRESDKIVFKNSDKDFNDTTEVDIKLLKYANETGATIITNDFNLNKLAVVQGIKVLNINELANSVKTVVIPGEKLIVSIIKEGKEKNQGLAYLEDGTMIVVEDGRDKIGETVQVTVSTVLQTAAGKMIFTKLV